jgi:hypothetical protein
MTTGAAVTFLVVRDRLFNDGDLRNALEGHARGMDEEIARAPEDHLLHVDEDEWVSALVERYRIEPPTLLRDKWWMDKPAEVQIDVRYDGAMRAILDYSRPALVNGFQVVVHVPFTGEADVFKFTPNTRNYNPPIADVRRDEVQIVVEYPADAPKDVKAHAESVLGSIETYLGWARSDADAFNATLEQRARSAIQARRKRVVEAYERLHDTGIPMHRPDESPKTYIADVLVRRPSPSIPPASATSKSIALEPVLSDAVFEHILGVLRGAAEAMERSPKTYAGMGEEDRRQVLLAALNTHYRGQTTAEAFNVTGKTDILVRHQEGRNLFIGECKLWEGVKGFAATVDQLFGYTGWRDTKLAVIMFVREKDLTSVVEKGRGALGAHPQFVAWADAASETELRATMGWPGDERRHADLNVFFVHTPH